MLQFCKSCTKKISKDAMACPKCGDADPFMETELLKKTKETKKRIAEYNLEMLSIGLFGTSFSIWLISLGKWWSILLGLLTFAGVIMEIKEKRDDIKWTNEQLASFKMAKTHYNQTGHPIL